jgi:purine nucleosidase/pyrimidine-specific ribonucleoside hydrolase
MSADAIPIVLDCDPGHDDAIAILLALASSEVELLAITTANALRVLELAGHSDVPVAAGANRPLVRPLTVAAHVHGDSGLDGPVLPDATTEIASDDAVAFIASLVARAEVPVTLVPTGPLTNIATYLDAHGGEGLERIVLMGGAIAEGNMTPAAEFNIWADPEAAHRVFHSGLPVVMAGLDVTHRAVTTPAIQAHLRSTGRIGAFVADLVDFFSMYHRETYGWEGAPIHDAVAVAEVIRPGLLEMRYRNVEVELESDLCRGRTVVDLWNRTERPPNVHVGVGLDTDGFFDLLVDRIGALG